jgi:two-component system nitrogen regulation sensor histidine kinase NtrY
MLRTVDREPAEVRTDVSRHPRRFWGTGLFGLGWGLAAILTAVSVYMASSAPGAGPIGPSSRTVLLILAVNLLLILLLSASAGRRVLILVFEQGKDAGARLHLRFVTLFALVAVVPAIIVAMVFGALVTRAVDNWFSQRVQTVVENSASVSRSYVDEQSRFIQNHVTLMSGDLNRVASGLTESPVTFDTTHYKNGLNGDFLPNSEVGSSEGLITSLRCSSFTT